MARAGTPRSSGSAAPATRSGRRPPSRGAWLTLRAQEAQHRQGREQNEQRIRARLLGVHTSSGFTATRRAHTSGAAPGELVEPIAHAMRHGGHPGERREQAQRDGAVCRARAYRPLATYKPARWFSVCTTACNVCARPGRSTCTGVNASSYQRLEVERREPQCRGQHRDGDQRPTARAGCRLSARPPQTASRRRFIAGTCLQKRAEAAVAVAERPALSGDRYQPRAPCGVRSGFLPRSPGTAGCAPSAHRGWCAADHLAPARFSEQLLVDGEVVIVVAAVGAPCAQIGNQALVDVV